MQVYERKYNKSTERFRPVAVLPFLAVTLVLNIGLFLIIGIIYTFTQLDFKALPPLALITSMLSLLTAAFLAGRATRYSGGLTGGVLGIANAAVVYILGVIAGITPIISAHMLLIFITCFLIGALGGIIGINARGKRRRYSGGYNLR